MTSTQKFIEDAIKGGWSFRSGSKYLLDKCTTGDIIFRLKGSANRFECPIQKILLDPLTWQAVGKTRGWEPYSPHDVTAGEQEYIGEWLEFQHTFIDHLADGKTIDEALQTIE